MSEYIENSDLIRRVLANYDANTCEYDITRLLEAICFCLILLRENCVIEIPEKIRHKIKQPSSIDSQNFIRHMRNSFCHLHFMDSILAKGDPQLIENITFKDKNNENINFNVTLSVQDLKTLLELIRKKFY